MALDEFDSYDLHESHKNRYFAEREDLLALLKSVRKWIKTNDVDVVDINIENWWSEDEEEIMWAATVLYTGGTNVEA